MDSPNPQNKTLNCGRTAALNLEPYDVEISGNFEIPLHIGRSIAFWDDPDFSPASKATFMRPDDYVVGMTFAGESVAFPLWITDYYHVVNFELAETRLMFTTCERCQSGSAFISVIDGKAAKFAAMGMYNASLTLTERSGFLQESGIWLHYEGICIHGPRKGQILEQLPTYHLTWKDWCRMHPSTRVMQVPKNVHHEDARLGHGREELFSRPGMDPPLIQTITGDLDDRFPENEIVIGVNCDAGVKAWPLREVKKNDGCVCDFLGEHPVVVFAGPRPEQCTMAAYSRTIDGVTLSFIRKGQCYTDLESGSLWDIEGRGIGGDYSGSQLIPLRWQYVRWHAWFYPHRQTELYLYNKPLPLWPDIPQNIDVGPFIEVLDRFPTSTQLTIENIIIQLQLPHEASSGLVLRADGDRLNIYRFNSREAALDYVELQGAWFCPPIALKLGRKFSRVVGQFVVESDPERQYEGPSQFVRLPTPEVSWSKWVTENRFTDSNIPETRKLQEKEMFTDLFRHLRKSGFDVVETAFLPHSQLCVGVQNAVAATINADRFAIQRFESREYAKAAMPDFEHALRVGKWIFRSTPSVMFKDPCYEMLQLPHEKTDWSSLLHRPRLEKALKRHWETDDTDIQCMPV